MRFLLSFFLLSLMGCSHTTTANSKKQASYHYDIGTQQLINGNLPRAIGSLRQAVLLDPQDPGIHNNLGVAYFARGKYDLASEHIKTALKLKPGYTDARNNLAGIYIETGQYAAALKELNVCLQDLTYQTPEKVYLHFGLAYFRTNQFKLASDNFKKTLEIKREHCQAMNYYGRTQYELKEFKLASKSLDQAIYFCREQKFDEPHFYSGLSFLKLGNRELASARFNEVVKLYPEGKYAKQAQVLLEGIQ